MRKKKYLKLKFNNSIGMLSIDLRQKVEGKVASQKAFKNWAAVPWGAFAYFVT